MKKKMIVAMVLLGALLFTLTGCGQRAVCDFCGEEKKCETRTMLGEEINVCEDCLDELEGLVG